MKNKINFILIFLVLTTAFSCTTRRIIIKTPSLLNDEQYAYRKGDSLLVLKIDDFDKYPNCSENNNHKDSLKNISFQYIDSIENTYFTIYSKRFYWDTITHEDRWKLKKKDKDQFKLLWKHYNYCTYLTNDTIIYIKKKYTSYDFQKIYYDSVSSIIMYNCFTECDNYFQRRFWKPFFHINDLKFLRLELSNFKLKVKGRY